MYKIKAVSKMLNMPTVTIRSWETRYNAIIPKRTESGHRVYTQENLNDLKWLKKQVHENGLNVSQAVKLLKAKKETKEAMPTKVTEQPFHSQIEELFEAVKDLDATKCDFLLELYFSQFQYKKVFFQIIVPLMYKVGEAWENGELHVAKEHMISNIVIQRAMRFFNLFDTSPSLPKVMAICPEDEQHQLGLILITLLLREKNYPVYYIGANTPLDGLGELIEEKQVEIVAISTSRKSDEAIVNHYIETLSQQNPELKFLISGLGIEESKFLHSRWYFSPQDKDWEKNLSEVLNH